MKLRLSDLIEAINNLPKRPPPWSPHSIFIPTPDFFEFSKSTEPTDAAGITLHVGWTGEKWEIQNPTQITFVP